jgi:hypothetical protein
VDSGWEERCSDRYTGIEAPVNGAPNSALAQSNQTIKVAGETWLRFDLILTDILKRRPKFLADPDSKDFQLPPFSCDIVEISDGGGTVQAVLCFDTGKKMIYAVFVEVDLFSPAPSSSYREVKWTRRERASTCEPLEGVAELLSLNQRMCSERIGPYGALDPDDPHQQQQHPPLRDWSALCTARSVEPDEWTVRDPRCFGRGAFTAGGSTRIPYEAVYPDAQVFDNRAVMFQIPVRKLTCRSTGLELAYG